MKPLNDPFLEDRLTRYDQWLSNGRISFSSKVVPVLKSVAAQQWVIPSEQAMQILNDAGTVAVQECECRRHYQRCSHPLEVCFIMNAVADKTVRLRKARYVALKEAEKILEKANASGLVHLALYMPDHEIFALCSCCDCCCHDLQIVKHYNRKDLMARSEYIAVTDAGLCSHCGECVDRCVFKARRLKDDLLVFDPDACMGCGLCISVCDAGALTMEKL